MADQGHEETERLLKRLEAEITKEYAQAEREIQKKLDDYLKRFKTKDELKQKALKAGEITQAEYDKWRLGQLMIGQRWEEMKTSIAQDLAKYDQIAKSTALGHMPDVYAINHNYGTFQVEKAAKVDTSYTLYDRDTVENLLKDEEGNFIPLPGKKVRAAINRGEAVAWNKKNVQSVMLQSILQGESISGIATRLSETVSESNRKAAIRNARTMTTGVENAGRIGSYKRAEDMGIVMQKQWLATLDGRTRHEHRELDGQTVPVDANFEVDGYEIEYPGDPAAAPEMIYNCRCTLIASLKGFERDWSDHRDADIEGKTYDEWKAEKESYSFPITRQEDYSEQMRSKYIKEYQEYSKLGEENKRKKR